MYETQAQDEICRLGRGLFERGYVHATQDKIENAQTPYRNLDQITVPNLWRFLIKNYA